MELYATLGEKIEIPSKFLKILEKIVEPMEAEILLCLEDFTSAKQISVSLSYDEERIENILELLFKNGFISKKDNKYHIKNFYSIIDTFLGEGRYQNLEKHEVDSLREYYLRKRLEISTKLMKEKKIPVSSKVIPVMQSFEGSQYILPTERALHIMQKAKTVALADCTCRTAFKNCDNPVETCILLDHVADELLERGVAREISLREAEETLLEADKYGLVHLTIYNPAGIYAICSCCECCCHDLQSIKKYGRPDITAKSDYIAFVENTCTHCGICVERCVFDARRMDNGKMIFEPEKCYGCGLCVSTCPENAIKLIPRHKGIN